MNTRSKTLLQAALLVLLFTMQGLCHAHQVDHFMTGDGTPCSVCSAGGQLEYTTIETEPVLLARSPALAQTAFHTITPTASVPSFHFARAPPLSP